MLKWLSPIFIYLLVLFICGMLIRSETILFTIMIIGMYISVNYYMTIIFIVLGRETAYKDSVYVWLDTLKGSDQLLRQLFLDIDKNREVLVNLEKVFEKLNFITKFEKKKMKLLRGYFKTLNDEGVNDLLYKTVLAIIVTVIAWSINKGTIWGSLTLSGMPKEMIIDTTVFKILNFLTILYEILLFLIVFILGYFKSKKRNKIIVEILDVCIDEFDNK
ncbi:hypothetical protein [Metabacillus fastidiosus]|uniref:hypothetical protein n=1 Tax=Metabacillus fastidiosus TaxID=1458 RepID=UPI003D279BCB